MYYNGRGRPYRIPGGDAKVKVMSNADRRRMGVDQDEQLEDFDPNYKKPE